LRVGELSLHCAILSNPPIEKGTQEYLALVKYLVSAIPDAPETKSSQGWTPLHVAVAIRRPEIVEFLLSVGANQRVRDNCSRNVIHNMVVPPEGQTEMWTSPKSHLDPDKLRAIIGLFDKKHVEEMLLERCTLEPSLSTVTPLAYWMSKNTDYKKPDIIEVLTEYSRGDDMGLVNGEGDLPLHQASSFPFASPFAKADLASRLLRRASQT
jgi:ankyrin repeat protein